VIALLLGGAASGKSRAAEGLAAGLGAPVTYVATWAPTDDPDMIERVAAHRARRPADWAVREVSGADLPAVLERTAGTVLVDALGTWVAGTWAAGGGAAGGFAAAGGFDVPTAELCRALTWRSGDSVVVSDEVGMGVHPATEVGRQFRDVLGAVNQAVAAIADQAWLVVAGRLLALDRPRWDGP
jgi:adenosyl cobinamide kinase/adenosyl cobinamide phosphate guanylyltransferase